MRIAVIGLGLIGGSIARAVRERVGAQVAGFDRDTAVSEAALAAGVVDRACATAAEAVGSAQAAFLAVPVGALSPAVGAALEAAPGDCVVTDVGSTKRAIVAAHTDSRFVGGHPMAGSEHSGLRHARADMFDAATWYLTPTSATSPDLCERLRRLLEAIGARPRAIDPGDHDRLVATVSHLPHVIANVLVSQAVATLPPSELHGSATGPSFRDATRVAGAPSPIWTDIYLTNADLLEVALRETVARLEEFHGALLAADRSRIDEFVASAGAAHLRLVEGQP
ncbi:MAG: prephenate dehydrogenase/arogenate dehydrogenase family protein [Solirubrobacterales bacterium]|nr:prephenate dehydrogenase/arogenate dehydrogenase family protein [Solirubrobacterales bacterium]